MNPKAIVRAYIIKRRPTYRAELDWFGHQPTLESTIKYAAWASRRNGTRHPHQNRLSQETLDAAKRVLLANSEAIAKATSFEELHDLIERLIGPIHGAGRLYIYDTALRIGAKLGLRPKRVYLHAGAQEGAQALGFGRRDEIVDVGDFPPEFGQLEADEIEDLLCVFKGDLKAPG